MDRVDPPIDHSGEAEGKSHGISYELNYRKPQTMKPLRNEMITLPRGSGMSFFVNQMMMEQITSGRGVPFIDVGLKSSEILRVGGNYNKAAYEAAGKKTFVPYYQKFDKRKPA